jgi:hypothetical protein
LLGNSCKQTCLHSNKSTCNNRGTAGNGVFYGVSGVRSRTKLKVSSFGRKLLFREDLSMEAEE